MIKMNNIPISTSHVENTILNLLTTSETSFSYPSLQPDALEHISANVTDIIYTTLKQKSFVSTTNRCNLLKFLNNICKTPEFHLADDHYKVYLEAYKDEFCKTNYPKAEELSRTISKELSNIPCDLYSKVTEFCHRKNAMRNVRAKRLEFIKQLDQECLNKSLDVHISKNVLHYETSQTLIDYMLKRKDSKPAEIVDDCREKQVRFCYALVNIAKDVDDVKVLERALLQIHNRYEMKPLEVFEIKLLEHLWLLGDCCMLDLSELIMEKFPFIIDKIVLQFCTEVLKLTDSLEVVNYFSILSTNPKTIKLQSLCAKNPSLHYKIKNLIFELYVFSYCNKNILRFVEYIL